jgi:hypothetical protein
MQNSNISLLSSFLPRRGPSHMSGFRKHKLRDSRELSAATLTFGTWPAPYLAIRHIGTSWTLFPALQTIKLPTWYA